MKSPDSLTTLQPIKPGSALILSLIQSIAVRTTPRGLPRFLWLSRRALFGGCPRIAWYQRRFRCAHDFSSYYGIMTACGFIHRAVDRLLKTLIATQAGDVCFVDAGANVGFVSLLACSSVDDNQRVHSHCFEPDPRPFKWLELNASLNNHQLILNKLALGASEGTATLNLASESCRSTMLQKPEEGFSFTPTEGEERVDVTTLDIYCGLKGLMPHIIKVDVEGYESMVLEGAVQTLRCARPYLIVEINRATLAAAGSSPAELLAKIIALDYHLVHIDASQAGLSSRDVEDRPKWRNYPRVNSGDVSSSRLFDVLAVPCEKT